MNTEPLQPGCVRLVKLAREGRLAKGDIVETARLGACVVQRIHSTSTLDVMDGNGNFFRLRGISFGADARMEN